MIKKQNAIISAAIVCLLSSSSYSTENREYNFQLPGCSAFKTMIMGFGLLLMPNRVESGPTITHHPTNFPTVAPTLAPTLIPTLSPTLKPTLQPTTGLPTLFPTTAFPTLSPTMEPTLLPTLHPTTRMPTLSPTTSATLSFDEIISRNWMFPGKSHVDFDLKLDFERTDKK